MCLNPVLIDNPYRGLENVGYNYLHDCRSLKLMVPCGYCAQCVALKQSYFVQRCQCETFDNYLFFCTLTYNDNMIRRLRVNDYEFKYADFKDIQNMWKRIRNDNLLSRSFRYFCVSEYGGKRHRPHFHMLISIPRNSTDNKWTPFILEDEIKNTILSQWVRNVGSRRSPIYLPLCDYLVTSRGRTYDLHYINPHSTTDGEADVAFYVSKYLLKYSKYVENLHSALKLNLDPDEFRDIWNKLKPKCVCSKSWGNPKSPQVKDHIRKGIDFSVQDRELPYPIFINPISGQHFPLSPYYKKYFMTLSDAHSFYYKMRDDNSSYTCIDSMQDLHFRSALNDSYSENCELLSSRDESNNFLDLI